MRHPLRSLAGQGFWYTLGNVLVKLGGLVLLPLYSNAEYLSVAAFGRWGVFEVTVQIAVATLGLQLRAALVRFYAGSDHPERSVAASWWLTLLVALLTLLSGLSLALGWAAEVDRRVYAALTFYITFELMLGVPLALLQARGEAFRHTALSAARLLLTIGLNLLMLVVLRRGLTGLVEAYALSSAISLVGAVALTFRSAYVRPLFDRAHAWRLLRFSLPLVIGGLGSYLLNAGDRYILKIFRSNEEIALYAMAAKFGGVVNMFGVQPLLMALLPVLYSASDEHRSEMLRLLMRYLAIGFGFLIVGLSLFAGPVLSLLGADPYYQDSVPLIPWIAMGFALFGMSVPFDGILTLHHRTGIVSFWVSVGAVFNLVLNVLLVPSMGPLGAAVATLVSYLGLFIVRHRASRRAMEVQYDWRSTIGVGVVTAVVAFGGILIPYPAGITGWLHRGALMAGWGGAIMLAGWLRPSDFRSALTLLRRKKAESDPAEPSVAEGVQERETSHLRETGNRP